MSQLNRRQVLQLLGFAGGAALVPRAAHAFASDPQRKPTFLFCLNTATIRGHNLGLVNELETASRAGFRAVEIWMDTLQTYLKSGGTLPELKQRLNGLGLQVANCIGFAEWIVEDDGQRRKGLEQMKQEMDLLAQINCPRIAAPPVGATDVAGLDLKKAAERYRVVLELGDRTGVVPQLEMWGFSKNLSRVSEVLYVATESGHASAKVLLDVFHLYKGGSPLETLSLMRPTAVDILHMNDYPANISAANITDADRLYAGNGVAPLHRILKLLQKEDQPLILSTEVFNKNYYNQDALVVAKTALAKMKAVVQQVK